MKSIANGVSFGINYMSLIDLEWKEQLFLWFKESQSIFLARRASVFHSLLWFFSLSLVDWVARIVNVEPVVSFRVGISGELRCLLFKFQGVCQPKYLTKTTDLPYVGKLDKSHAKKYTMHLLYLRRLGRLERQLWARVRLLSGHPKVFPETVWGELASLVHVEYLRKDRAG